MSESIESVLARKWFYRFELPGNRVTDTYVDEEALRFHADRLEMLNGALDEAFAGSLEGKTCLDIACHQGFYALNLAQRGLRVRGVDVRQEHVDAANLMKSALGVEDVVFGCRDITDCTADDFEQADVVLLLGLIYHLEDPIRILRLARALTKRVCVIETQVASPAEHTVSWGSGTASKQMKGYFAVIDEVAEADSNNLETGLSGLCLCPSKDAILWVLDAIGFSKVEVIAPVSGAGEALFAETRLMVKAIP